MEKVRTGTNGDSTRVCLGSQISILLYQMAIWVMLSREFLNTLRVQAFRLSQISRNCPDIPTFADFALTLVTMSLP